MVVAMTCFGVLSAFNSCTTSVMRMENLSKNLFNEQIIFLACSYWGSKIISASADL